MVFEFTAALRVDLEKLLPSLEFTLDKIKLPFDGVGVGLVAAEEESP